MKYVELVSEAAYRTTPEDVQKLRDAGWKENRLLRRFTSSRSSPCLTASPMLSEFQCRITLPWEG